MKKTAQEPNSASPEQLSTTPLTCGVVMPLSTIDGLPASHWSEVFSLIAASVKLIPDLAFNVKMVSDSDDVGVIHHRIVSNLYQNDIVICDVSAKNPNVMFELGMRLAFDKPVVIIKDNLTEYTFDTGVIEHISYPRDLRYSSMIEFQTKLAAKVAQTYRKAAESDPDYKSFLSHFGTFAPATVESKVATRDDLLALQIEELRAEFRAVTRKIVNRQPIGLGTAPNIAFGDIPIPKLKGAVRLGDLYNHNAEQIVIDAYHSVLQSGEEVTYDSIVTELTANRGFPKDLAVAAVKTWASSTDVVLR